LINTKLCSQTFFYHRVYIFLFLLFYKKKYARKQYFYYLTIEFWNSLYFAFAKRMRNIFFISDIAGGYLCFIVSILGIGVVTAIIGDVASYFGCTLGIKDSVTAIVFVALGTSIPGKYLKTEDDIRGKGVTSRKIVLEKVSCCTNCNSDRFNQKGILKKNLLNLNAHFFESNRTN